MFFSRLALHNWKSRKIVVVIETYRILRMKHRGLTSKVYTLQSRNLNYGLGRGRLLVYLFWLPVTKVLGSVHTCISLVTFNNVPAGAYHCSTPGTSFWFSEESVSSNATCFRNPHNCITTVNYLYSYTENQFHFINGLE